MFIGCFRPGRLTLLAGFMLLTLAAFSQTFTGTPVHVLEEKLNHRLTTWNVYRIDANAVAVAAQENVDKNAPVYVNLGQYHWALHFESANLLAPGYHVRWQDGQQETSSPASVTPYKGYGNNPGDNLRLTLGKSFFYGYVVENQEKIYVEPLWYTNPAFDKDLYVVYSELDVIRDNVDGRCGIDDDHSLLKEHVEQKYETAEAVSGCFKLDLAIAGDASMITKYGSVSGVEAHNIGVINDVQGDYTGNFNHDIEFNIVVQVISSANPWGASANSGTYLNNFRNWAQAGGFGFTHDIGELWTDIDFTGTTIGLAFVGTVCTSFKYHVLQDFDPNADLLRCMTSHEMGHNFNLNHDPCTSGPNFIMCPFVSTSTIWSSTSVNAFNSFVQPLTVNGCLTACVTGPPPTPGFSWSPNPGCAGQPVTFTNESSGTILTYLWSFPGGSPSSSTQENPTVVWTTPGVKNVTLTLNSGSSTQAAIVKQVTIVTAPTANFTSVVDDLTVSFTANATNATSYEWDFGDGEISFDQNPIHTYAEANIYTVILTVTGPCGTATKTQTVNTAPTAAFSVSPSTGCAPLAVTFDNESSPNAISYVWQFPGGAPSSSNQANPIVVYTLPGSYTATLTATNSQGSSVFSVQNVVVVQGTPTASWSSVANGLTVTFTNNSVSGTSYLWNFGDGQTSTLANPVHTYATGGTYTVVLTTTNICGTANNTQTLVLATPPVASFTATPTSGCGPLTVTFSNTSANATGIEWSFPGGNPATSTAANPTVVYNTPGTYTASLTATNAAGPNTATQTITVQTVPATAFGSTVAGAVATFANTSSNAVSYAWNFGDGGNSTLANPTHTYSADGVYTVVLTSTNACGTSTAVQTVTIVTPPVAAFSANNTTGCAPFTVQFNNSSSSNAVTYEWQFPGGTPATSTASNPTVVYNTPGQYTVTLIATNAAGSNTSVQTNYIQVITTPVATFTAATNGLQVNFTSTAATATSWLWNFGDGNTSTLENPAHTYATAGNYTVTLSATNTCGNNTATQTVVIVESPTASFSATPTTGCNNLTVQFSNTSAGNPSSFLWQFPGGTPATSTSPNPTVVYNMPGSYSVTFTATNSAGSGSTTQTNYITVGTSPGAAFTATGNANMYSFANSSTGATTYSWDFGDNTSSTLPNPTHTYTADGVYTVVLTAVNSCGTSTSTQTFTVVTPPLANFTATNVNGCAPLSVTYNNISSANSTSFVWLFPGGNPATSTAASPTVLYSSPGVYSATLTATNAVGSSNVTQTNLVNVGTVPSPNFVTTANGASYSFSNASTGATVYSWNFGDGGTSTSENPNHFYLADGTYTVVLTASNSCGTATSTQTVNVITPPLANFTATGNIGCAPITVTFTNTSSANATGFSWQFPGGNPASSTDTNPVVTYENAGVYSVILTASNNAGNATVTQTDMVVAGGAPTAGFIAAVNGAEASFSNTSNGATLYNWEFGDGAVSTDASPVHVYTQDGTYTVVLTSSNNCGIATSTQTVVVVTAPTANFTPSATNGCTPFAVTFTNASSANATSFSWDFPGGVPATSTEANPTVTYNNPGFYSVTLIATNAAGSATALKTDLIQVNTVPVTTFGVQTGGLSVEFINGSFNAQSFFWNFGDGTTSTDVSPTHDYNEAGSYTVVLKATNDCGTAEYTLVVNLEGTAPFPAFSTATPAKGCSPLTVTFQDESIGQPTAWNWSFPGGTPATSTLQNPVVSYSTPGVYDVSLEVTNIYGTNVLMQPSVVEVLALPNASFEASNTGATVAFDNLSQNATAYQWNFGDGSPVSTAENPTHVYTQTGTYVVSLTALNDCGSTVYQISIDVTVSGVSQAEWAKEVRLYPNPNTGKFTLELTGTPKEELQFDLINPLGQLIKRETGAFTNGKITRIFDYGQLPSGTYTLRVSDQNEALVIRVSISE